MTTPQPIYFTMMLTKFRASQAFNLGAIALLLLSCSGGEPSAPDAALDATADGATETGTLEFRANGEDFVRQGFVSKDGWQIDFDNLYVHLSEVEAYQADAAYDPDSGKPADPAAVAAVAEAVTVDLAAGDAQADPVLIKSVSAPAGQYTALSWSMSPAPSGPAAGSTLMLVGTATKEGESVPFTIQLDPEYTYNCGEFVGDARKGILTADGQADVEATFHFDHVFGDGEAPADDDINTGAVGFGPFAELAGADGLKVDMATLAQSLSPENYSKLEEALIGLGHVGEGHCSEVSADHTHDSK